MRPAEGGQAGLLMAPAARSAGACAIALHSRHTPAGVFFLPNSHSMVPGVLHGTQRCQLRLAAAAAWGAPAGHEFRQN